MDYTIKQTNSATQNRDIMGVVDIINYYIEDVEGICADYREEKINSRTVMDWIKLTKQNHHPFYVVDALIDGHMKIIGFGFLLPYGDINISTISRSVNITVFVDHNYRYLGIGPKILEKLISDAKGKGIDNIMVNISSLNVKSIEFHTIHGFKECGRFIRAGKKHGKDFDIIWMQLLI